MRMGRQVLEGGEETETWIVPKGRWVCPFTISGLLLVDKPTELGDEQVMRFAEIVKKEKRIQTDALLLMKISIPRIVEKGKKHHLYESAC